MSKQKGRYKIIQEKEYLYIIQESISDIHPVYKNSPLNLYLLIGTDKALLIDTGCRIEPLKPIIEEIINEKALIVVNSHFHWDHVLGNRDFNEVYIHEKEASCISRPYNISFLKTSPLETIKAYEKYDFMIPPARTIRTLTDGDKIELGDLEILILHAPGHSPGSICFLSNKNELFTGDVVYYGEQFLPPQKDFPIVLRSLEKLIKICEEKESIKLYPSHGITPCDVNLLIKLHAGIKNIKNIWNSKKVHYFFSAHEVKDDTFTYYVSFF
ncbi:MAG: MBL fold metallo-hydrolase [Promethearchaeota archaeon]